MYCRKKRIAVGSSKGSWALINYSQDDENKKSGWIFDTFLATKNKFRRYSTKLASSITLGDGDIENKIIFNSKNNYIRTMKNYYPDAKIKEKTFHGKVFKYRNIIWLKDRGTMKHPVFLFLDKNGNIIKSYNEGFEIK